MLTPDEKRVHPRRRRKRKRKRGNGSPAAVDRVIGPAIPVAISPPPAQQLSSLRHKLHYLATR